MKASEIRELSIDKIREQLDEARENEFRLRSCCNEARLGNNQRRGQHFLLTARNPVTGATLLNLQTEIGSMRTHLCRPKNTVTMMHNQMKGLSNLANITVENTTDPRINTPPMVGVPALVK